MTSSTFNAAVPSMPAPRGLRLWLVSSVAMLFTGGSALAAPEESGDDKTTTVVVEAAPSPAEGRAEDGYRVDSASAGALGPVQLMDTPYSVAVTSRDLMDNLQAGTVSEALKYNAAVYGGSGNNLVGGGAAFAIRGFTTDTNESMIGGLRMYSRTPLEDKERVEVLEGASSLLYGFANPAGTVNYVLKQPTAVPYHSIKVGTYGGYQGYTHGDFGGPLDEAGRLAYRLNLLYVGAGEVGIEDNTRERYLGTAVVDWHVSPDTLWSFDVSHYKIDIEGGDNIFNIGTGVSAIPKAPDASQNFMPKYSVARDGYDRLSTRLVSDVNDALTVRGALGYSYVTMFRHRASTTLVNNAGDYILKRNYYDRDKETFQGNLYADIRFSLAGIDNTVTTGVNAENTTQKAAYPFKTGSVSYAGVYNLYADSSYPADKGGSTIGSPSGVVGRTTLTSAILADRIDFDDQWSLLAGGTLSTIKDETWDYGSYLSRGTYAAQGGYDESVLSPSGAVIFKPVPDVTTYLSYNEALQKGATSSTTTDINYGESLAPYVARQIEFGVKTAVGGIDLTANVFHIRQAYAYSKSLSSSQTLYTSDGEEVHVGGEVSLTGKVTPDLTVTGGVSAMKATIEDVNDARLRDKVPVGVPRQMARVYAEYALPFVPGLTLTGGIVYTGPVYVNATNTVSIPAATTGDIGARYRTQLYGTDTILRFNATNVTGEDYWTSTGGSLALGQPQTFLFSTEFIF